MIKILNLKHDIPSNIWDFKIDRTSPLGNKYKMSDKINRDESCDLYDENFTSMIENTVNAREYLDWMADVYSLYSKLNLYCWCYPKRCHGETIKRHLEKRLGIITQLDFYKW